MRRSAGDDRGAAAVLALAMLAVILTVAFAGAAVALLAVARQRVAMFADVAALAGAQAMHEQCAEAAASAAANGAVLTQCSADDGDVVVTVSAPTPEFVARVLAIFGTSIPQVSATARAGPPD